MTWASADDVVTVTGRETTAPSLALAHTMVELFAGAVDTTDDEDDPQLITNTNLRRLRNAVCFQAVWLDTHPDAIDAMDVEGVSQDGLNATYANANAHLLAPLAKRFIDRLSWRTQGIRIRRSARTVTASNRGNRDSAVADDAYEWSPLPFGAQP